MHVLYPRTILPHLRPGHLILQKIKPISRPLATRSSASSSGPKKSENAQKGQWPYDIYASDRITDRKSIFLAHASTLPSAADFPILLDQLEALPRMRRATHCMYAYRLIEGGKLVCGQNDGGEGGSGDRLSRLLELSGYENVAVVVWRWYGGVQLGSDRWKRISDAAKQVLEKGQFKRNKQIK